MEDFYINFDIPYKKSFLFYGPSGNGKSSMIKAISFEFKRHINYLNISLIKNIQELMNILLNINYKETILVIDNIDINELFIYKKSNYDLNDYVEININKQINLNHISLSILLNYIDRIHNNHDMIIIMISNYPDLIDKILFQDKIIDEIFFFDYCDHEQIYLMFKKIYNENCLSLELIKLKIDLTKYKISYSNIINSIKIYHL
jgi:chaperone BCS1